MAHPRPVIGITCGTLSGPANAARYGANQVYAAAVQAGGGLPVMIPPSGRGTIAVLDHVDALLLPGGADVDPSFYGAPPGPLLHATDPARDEMEVALVRAARRRGMRVLGICRGLQTINVACGGTLYQDLVTDRPGTPSHDTPREKGRARIVHSVTISAGSWFARAAAATSLEVNSLHHQAALKVGRGLQVTARSPDGVIEGLESSDGRTVAVQCHPEELIELAWARRLFRTFVGDARRGTD